jgi:membrane protease YdiL (CAAX protease family)
MQGIGGGALEAATEVHSERAAGRRRRAPHAGHGWWPYVLPYFAFMLTGEFAAGLPESAAPVMLFVKPGVPAALMLYFWRGGAYPELRGFRFLSLGALLDVLLGIALAGLWMAPFLFFPSLLVFEFMRPDTEVGFDSALLGASLVPLALGVRMLGYGLVTPFFEELFIRSFVMRYAVVYRGDGDFRDVPMALFTWGSFITTLVILTFTHVPWEYAVMFIWSLCTNLWFYYRKHLFAVIIAHGVTNASILLAAILAEGSFLDSEGNPLSLWFFV